MKKQNNEQTYDEMCALKIPTHAAVKQAARSHANVFNLDEKRYELMPVCDAFVVETVLIPWCVLTQHQYFGHSSNFHFVMLAHSVVSEFVGRARSQSNTFIGAPFRFSM